MTCRGLHCDGCRGGPGGGVVVLLVMFGAAGLGLYVAWPTILATLAAVGAFLLAVLQVLVWALASVAAVVAVGVGTVLVARGVHAYRAAGRGRLRRLWSTAAIRGRGVGLAADRPRVQPPPVRSPRALLLPVQHDMRHHVDGGWHP